MNEKDNFALVPKLPSSLEKAEPGAKRILSDMVADTLALVKKESPSKRDVHVLMAGSPEFNEGFSFIVSHADDRLKAHFNFHFHFYDRMDSLAAALKRGKFDLALVQLHTTPPVEHRFSDKREVLLRAERLLAQKNYIIRAGLEVSSFLQSVHGIPVVMVSDTGGDEEAEKVLAAQVGARALFWCLHMDIQAFCECLSGILKDADKPTRIRPLRIVILDDEPLVCAALSMMLDVDLPNAEILTFTDVEAALEELERGDPDLFTTDWDAGIRGQEILAPLAERKAKYPIFVISANAGFLEVNGVLKEYADLGLNITLLSKPFTMEELRGELAKHLRPDKPPQHSQKTES